MRRQARRPQSRGSSAAHRRPGRRQVEPDVLLRHDGVEDQPLDAVGMGAGVAQRVVGAVGDAGAARCARRRARRAGPRGPRRSPSSRTRRGPARAARRTPRRCRARAPSRRSAPAPAARDRRSRPERPVPRVSQHDEPVAGADALQRRLPHRPVGDAGLPGPAGQRDQRHPREDGRVLLAGHAQARSCPAARPCGRAAPRASRTRSRRRRGRAEVERRAGRRATQRHPRRRPSRARPRPHRVSPGSSRDGTASVRPRAVAQAQNISAVSAMARRSGAGRGLEVVDDGLHGRDAALGVAVGDRAIASPARRKASSARAGAGPRPRACGRRRPRGRRGRSAYEAVRRLRRQVERPHVGRLGRRRAAEDRGLQHAHQPAVGVRRGRLPRVAVADATLVEVAGGRVDSPVEQQALARASMRERLVEPGLVGSGGAVTSATVAAWIGSTSSGTTTACATTPASASATGPTLAAGRARAALRVRPARGQHAQRARARAARPARALARRRATRRWRRCSCCTRRLRRAGARLLPGRAAASSSSARAPCPRPGTPRWPRSAPPSRPSTRCSTAMRRVAYALCGRPATTPARAPTATASSRNIAMAASTPARRGVERVAVLDWDVHHGNGTQACFYDRADVLTVSLHQDHGSWGRAIRRPARPTSRARAPGAATTSTSRCRPAPATSATRRPWSGSSSRSCARFEPEPAAGGLRPGRQPVRPQRPHVGDDGRLPRAGPRGAGARRRALRRPAGPGAGGRLREDLLRLLPARHAGGRDRRDGAAAGRPRRLLPRRAGDRPRGDRGRARAYAEQLGPDRASAPPAPRSAPRRATARPRRPAPRRCAGGRPGVVSSPASVALRMLPDSRNTFGVSESTRPTRLVRTSMPSLPEVGGVGHAGRRAWRRAARCRASAEEAWMSSV